MYRSATRPLSRFFGRGLGTRLGLKLFDVIGLLRQHPLKFKSLFVFDPVDSVLTVDKMVALLDVVYSPQGSSKRVSEEATFMHWDEFLHDLAHGLVGRHMHAC